MKQNPFYRLRNKAGLYLAHKGPDRWTTNLTKSQVLDSRKTPKDYWKDNMCMGEPVTVEEA